MARRKRGVVDKFGGAFRAKKEKGTLVHTKGVKEFEYQKVKKNYRQKNTPSMTQAGSV